VSISTYNILPMHLLWQLYHLLCMCCLFLAQIFFPFFCLAYILSLLCQWLHICFMFLKCPVQSLTRESAIHAFCHFSVSSCWSYCSISYHDNASTMDKCANFDVSIIFITSPPRVPFISLCMGCKCYFYCM